MCAKANRLSLWRSRPAGQAGQLREGTNLPECIVKNDLSLNGSFDPAVSNADLHPKHKVFRIFEERPTSSTKIRGDVTAAYFALALLLTIEMLVLMMKKTGTACIAIPSQTNVFIILIFKVTDRGKANTIPG